MDTASGPLTVLVVDDDPAIRLALARLLVRRGFRALTAGSLGEAMRVLVRRRDTVGVVVVDLTLGTEHGLALVEHLHRRRPGLPVVVFSAIPAGPDPAPWRALGVREYLPKPACAETIVRAIARAAGVPATAPRM